MLNKVFDQAKDKNVANYVVYAKAADSKIYKEAAFTNQVEQAEMVDAFLKGRLVICTDATNGKYSAPVYVDANKVAIAATVSSAVALVEYAAKAAA